MYFSLLFASRSSHSYRDGLSQHRKKVTSFFQLWRCEQQSIKMINKKTRHKTTKQSFCLHENTKKNWKPLDKNGWRQILYCLL
jgi:gas vesicle protein